MGAIRRLSIRAYLGLIQALLLGALAVVCSAAWLAIGNSNRFARELALLNRAQQFHQQADALDAAMHADVNAALLVADEDADAAEVVLASVRDNARRYEVALDGLKQIPLPADLSSGVAALRSDADAYAARATSITAIAVRNRSRALSMKEKFEESSTRLRHANDQTTVLFAQRTALAERESAAAAIEAYRWIVAAGIAVAGLTCLLVAIVGRSLRRSLGRVRDVARAIADGNLEIRADVRESDEVGELAGALNRMADELQSLIARLRAEADRDAFGTQLVTALEMSDTEGEVHEMVMRAMEQIAADLPMELLLSDSSRAHLERAAAHPKAGAPGCGVESPFSCVAVRRGNPVVFEDSELLSACPRLRNRACGAVSAVCVPISFMGRSLGVLHATGMVNQVPSAEQVARLTTLGIQAGSRIGTVRAFERTQLQAKTDPLTGLNNRRTLEEAVRDLAAGSTPYAFALADLDHFKRLNDGHGHEAGDKALRLFAEVLRKAVRGGDCVARWGGEEFALLFRGAAGNQAFEVVERIRAELAQTLVVSNSVPFTASFGVADSSMGRQFADVVRVADQALYRSKDAGRDRTTMGDPASSHVAERHESEAGAAIDLRMLAGGGSG